MSLDVQSRVLAPDALLEDDVVESKAAVVLLAMSTVVAVVLVSMLSVLLHVN
jgi:hypothetical protein